MMILGDTLGASGWSQLEGTTSNPTEALTRSTAWLQFDVITRPSETQVFIGQFDLRSLTFKALVRASGALGHTTKSELRKAYVSITSPKRDGAHSVAFSLTYRFNFKPVTAAAALKAFTRARRD